MDPGLSADPERSVSIPITTMNEGGASNGDYSGVPASVAFASGETAKTFAFRATQDTEDDDEESVKLGFGNLPTGVSAGTPSETTVNITDDDDPQVSVSYGATSYSVAEGGTVTVRVTLSADPERSVTIPITTMNEGGAANGDYSGVPANVVFASGETEQTFTLRATQDTGDDDEESVKLGFGNLPTGVSEGATRETVVSITDDDVPSVTVSFGQGSYSVAEGGTVTVRVTLSADPERSVNIPITTMNEGGAANGDCSGVPANVVFASGETEQTFTLRATQDTGDDDDESVKLGFGNLPTGVTEGTTTGTVVSITDDDVPSVTVSFGQSSYSVAEGGTVTVRVTLSADPERSVTIPLTATGQDSVSPADYSGVPASVVFASGETEQTFTLRATQDEVDDDGESVIVSFEAPLPDGVSEGAPHQSTVSITDDDDAAIVLSDANLIVEEGDATGVSYSVKLASQPTANVTVTISGHSGTDLILSGTTLNASRQLTFTTANWNTAQTVAIQADQDEDAGDDENTLTHTASGGGYVNVTADLPVTITDDETASIVLVPASLVVEEGDATGSSYTVKLSHVPTGMVTVTISGHSGTDLSLSGTTLTTDQLTFTTANWNTVQTVTVRADQDDDPFNDVATLLHAASGGSRDSATETLGVTVSDDETASIVLSPDSLTVEEGDATGSSYTVKLSRVPTGMVTVTISLREGRDGEDDHLQCHPGQRQRRPREREAHLRPPAHWRIRGRHQGDGSLDHRRRRARRDGELRAGLVQRRRGRHGNGAGDLKRRPRAVRDDTAHGHRPGQRQPRGLLGRARECGVRVGRDGEDLHLQRHPGQRQRRPREREAHLRPPAHRRIRGRHQGDGGLDHRRRRARGDGRLRAGGLHGGRGRHADGDRHLERGPRAQRDHSHHRARRGRSQQQRLLGRARERDLREGRHRGSPSPTMRATRSR